MRIVDLAVLAIEACERAGVAHMLTGAFATGIYGIPRSTKDVDLVLDVGAPSQLAEVMESLNHDVEFAAQVQFDSITWGKRHVGQTRENPRFSLEFFELFDDAFVREQFGRRVKTVIGEAATVAFVPTAEDVIVQKLRWGRAKDLIDARDVLAVQGPGNLDMDYIRRWCGEHGSDDRLAAALLQLPDP